MQATTNRLLTIAQAADRLGVHQKTLRRWADKGMVPVVKLPSGYRRFDPVDVERVRAEMRGDAPGQLESGGEGETD